MSSENSSRPDLRRYRRQIILPGWGVEAQETLRSSRVLVAGAGGLGCAVACTTGSLQAIEAIKYLVNSGPTLKGRMLIMDCSTMRFQELEARKNPHCPVCASI